MLKISHPGILPPTAELGQANIRAQDYTIPDPELTELGLSQCRELRESLKHRFGHLSAEEAVVIVSPMLRTLQTATVALDWLRDIGVRFVANADWQGMLRTVLKNRTSQRYIRTNGLCRKWHQPLRHWAGAYGGFYHALPTC